MSYVDTCPFCSREAMFDGAPDGAAIICKACGKYEITGTLLATIPSLGTRLRFRIGFWVRDQNSLGEQPRVSHHHIEQIEKLPEASVIERLDRLLTFGIAEQHGIGGVFSPYEAAASGATHSQSPQEVAALANALTAEGLLEKTDQQGYWRVTPRGYIRAAERPRSASPSGFIAMWFNPSMDPARFEGLEPAIRDAGYNPVIVSGVEHINKIDDEIVSQIRKSRFLVADFTGHRGGVYFEAGFAMGLGLPVFWTCQDDDLANLHFDIRQYNCINWTSTTDLSVRLRRRIEAVIGVGPNAPRS